MQQMMNSMVQMMILASISGMGKSVVSMAQWDDKFELTPTRTPAYIADAIRGSLSKSGIISPGYTFMLAVKGYRMGFNQLYLCRATVHRKEDWGSFDAADPQEQAHNLFDTLLNKSDIGRRVLSVCILDTFLHNPYPVHDPGRTMYFIVQMW